MISKNELNMYLQEQENIWVGEQKRYRDDQTYEGYCSGQLDLIEAIRIKFDLMGKEKTNKPL